MHHWFHETQAHREAHREAHRSTQVPFAEKIQLGCDCFDDAMMPLVESPFITVSIPMQTGTILPVGYRPPFSAAEKIFYSLKGPPAASV
jgi:hypothetical protein